MKHLVLFFLLIAAARAQWIVNDPVNTAVNSAVQAGQAANHIEILRQWAAQLEQLNRQLRELEAQLAVQQRIRDVMGNPTAAGAGMALRDLGATDLARTYGDTLAATRRLANAIDSLRRTSDGIYRHLDDRTVLGRDFVRQEPLYRRYAAVERQADHLAAVHEQTGARSVALQSEIAATAEQLRNASTQAEVDKHNAKLAVLAGQVAHLDAQRRDEADKLQTQQILNENQAAKERQDFLERQLAEERQTLAIVGAWQQSVKVGEHVVPPTLAIEVGGEKPARVVGANGIHAEGVLAPQMGFRGALVQRRKSLMVTLGAFDLRLKADPRTPLVVTGGRIAALACWVVLPPFRENGSSRAEQIEK